MAVIDAEGGGPVAIVDDGLLIRVLLLLFFLPRCYRYR